MIRTALFASVIALGAAAATAPSALAGEGTDPPITAVVPDVTNPFRGNVVGGGVARVVGGGETARIVYADPTVGQPSHGIPVVVGNGENTQIVYLPPGADAAAAVAAGAGIEAAGALAVAAATRGTAAATRVASAAAGAAPVIR